MRRPCPSPTRAAGRPRIEVAEIFRAHGAAYRKSHRLGEQQRKAMWAIENCRTEILGGHVDACVACGDESPSYNSCRNRHCPKCQGLAQVKWLSKRKLRILPTHYFHVVFTLPSELRPLYRRNPVPLFDLLFASAAHTLLDFGRHELAAQLGLTAVLHTWTRDLRLHPHLHCVVTGGGLDVERDQWVSTSRRFLFPVKALAVRFRGKLLDGIRRLRAAGELDLDGDCADLVDDRTFGRLLDTLYRKKWVVYSKRPFGGPTQVFEYLGRYTHRVAIGNARLVHVDDREVRFRTRDGDHASLPPEVFIGRFLLHVLPRAYVKIRHFGLMASGNATTRLERARHRIDAQSGHSKPKPILDEAPQDWREHLARLTGIDLSVCPRCGGRRVQRPLSRPPLDAPTASALPDTS